MRFEIVIQLGNDACQEGPEVAEMLRHVASRIDDGSYFTPQALGVKAPIYDLNGNKVGYFGAVKDEEEED